MGKETTVTRMCFLTKLKSCGLAKITCQRSPIIELSAYSEVNQE